MAIKINKYKVIVIDPPWPINKIVRKVRPNQLKFLDYETMSIDDIVQLPIPTLCANNSVVFLWVTLSTLPAGFECFKQWKLKYHIALTWNKGSGLCSFGFFRNSEIVLVGYLGNGIGDFAVKGIQIPSVFFSKSTKHSEKPNIFYQLVEVCYPGPKLSLFERKNRIGFDVWGDEAPNCVDLSWAGLLL